MSFLSSIANLFNANKKEHSTDILTSESGPIGVKGNTREVLAIKTSGEVYIAAGYENTPDVQSALKLAGKKGYALQDPVITTVESIASFYVNGENLKEISRHENEKIALHLLDLAISAEVTDIRIQIRNKTTTIKAAQAGMMFPLMKELPEQAGRQLLYWFANTRDKDDNIKYTPGVFQNFAATTSNTKIPKIITNLRLQYGPDFNNGQFLSIRLQYADKAKSNPDLTKLGFTIDDIEKYKIARQKRTGWVIVGGATGSGKTTALAQNATLSYEESNGTINGYTIEDPVEKEIPGFVQTSIAAAAKSNEDRALKFQEAAKAMKRAFPHFLLLSEMRDSASALMASDLMKQGTQVWTTIHVNSVIDIPTRLLDWNVPTHNVCDEGCLTLLSCQKLIPLLCECKIKYPGGNKDLENALWDTSGVHVRNPEGCPKCRMDPNTFPKEALETTNGLLKQSIVAEFLIPDLKFLEFIKQKDTNGARKYWIEKLGGETITEKIIGMVKQGIVDPTIAETSGKFVFSEHSKTQRKSKEAA